MKSVIAIIFACLVASSVAFAPPMMVFGKKKASAAPASKTKQQKKVQFIYEDGLTPIERQQRATQPTFLSGAAKSQKDESAIDPEYADVGNSNLSQSQTLTLISVVTLGLLAIVNAI